MISGNRFHHYHNFMMFRHKTCISPHQLKIGAGKGEPVIQLSINLTQHRLPESYKRPFFLPVLIQLSEMGVLWLIDFIFFQPRYQHQFRYPGLPWWHSG